MNRKQFVVLWISVLLFIGCGLIPPWTLRFGDSDYSVAHGPRWRWLWNPGGSTNTLHLNILIVEWVLVIVVAAALLISLRDRPKSN